MAQASIFQQILDPANRDDPYPLFAELRRTPVTREADGGHVVVVAGDPANRKVTVADDLAWARQQVVGERR